MAMSWIQKIHPYMRDNFQGTEEIRQTFKDIYDHADQKTETINNEKT